MPSETKICQSCEKEFIIEPEDFVFYEKIKVPPPTWCPDCRQQRRYAWRNERVLYRRPCDLCAKSTVTIYSPNKPFKVYCPPCWWGDGWSGLDYGRDFDFERPFFEQWQELQLLAPRIALLSKNSINSDYTNHSNNNKNCYLSFATFDSENVLYSANVWVQSRDSMDCYLASVEGGVELSYECLDSARIYGCQYSIFLKDSTNCYYSYDLRGCSDCFLSWNLRNKQYCIRNEQYTKEEYIKKLAEFNLGSAAARADLYKQWKALMEEEAIHKFATIERSVNCSGNSIYNSNNSFHAFDADKLEDSKYAIIVPEVKDSMDVYHVGFRTELIYESDALIHDYNVKFSHLSYDDSGLEYCDSCHNSADLFGCVSIKQGKYCILNKQYEPEQYEELKAKIVEHMKASGEYGEFFPPALSPFGYNETQGQIYMHLAKDEAMAKGYKWEDLVPGTYGKETLSPEQIPDRIEEVTDTILKEALRCVDCSRNYNIVAAELELYRRLEAPVSRLCPECRYRKRIAIRLPRKLWHRTCACKRENHFHSQNQCTVEFETPYSPERPDTVYCEQCYQQEVV